MLSSSWWHQVPLSRVMLALFTFFTPGRQNTHLQEIMLLIWKDFPSDIVSRDWAETLVGTVPCSEALMGLCWGPVGLSITPPIAEGSLSLCSSSTGWRCLPSVCSSPLPELCRVTLFVLCLLPPRLVSSIWEHSADWVSSAHRQVIYGCLCMASWLHQLWFPTQHLLFLDRGWQEKPVSKPLPFSAVSQQKKHYHVRLPDNTPQRFSHILLLSSFFHIKS